MHPYALSGRETSHPLDMRGWTTSNMSLLVEDDHALLVGTGYSVHQEALLAQLERLVGDRSLAIVIPRAEFSAMCNARPIADRFHVDMAYLRIPSPPRVFLNFRPQFPDDETDGLRDVPFELIERGHRLAVDLAGTRVLEVLSPELRLMPNSWGYDAATKTLLSSDIFTWVLRDTAAGPWLIDSDDPDTTTPAQIEHAPLGYRLGEQREVDPGLLRCNPCRRRVGDGLVGHDGAVLVDARAERGRADLLRPLDDP